MTWAGARCQCPDGRPASKDLAWGVDMKHNPTVAPTNASVTGHSHKLTLQWPLRRRTTVQWGGRRSGVGERTVAKLPGLRAGGTQNTKRAIASARMARLRSHRMGRGPLNL